MKSQASSLRGTGHGYFAVYSSLIYYPRPVWRVLFHVCLLHDILPRDTTGQFLTEKVEPSTCQVLSSQGMDFASAKRECACMNRQYKREPHSCTTHTSMCFTPCSQTTRIIQISAQHSAATIQIANTEEKGGF